MTDIVNHLAWCIRIRNPTVTTQWEEGKLQHEKKCTRVTRLLGFKVGDASNVVEEVINDDKQRLLESNSHTACSQATYTSVVLSSDNEGRLSIYDVCTGEHVTTRENAHTGTIRDLYIVPVDVTRMRILSVGSEDGAVRCWTTALESKNMLNIEQEFTLENTDKDPPMCVLGDFAHSSLSIFTGNSQGYLKQWIIPVGEDTVRVREVINSPTQLRAHDSPIVGLTFLCEGNSNVDSTYIKEPAAASSTQSHCDHVATAALDGTVKYIDIPRAVVLAQYITESSHTCITSMNSMVYTGSVDGKVRMYDVRASRIPVMMQSFGRGLAVSRALGRSVSCIVPGWEETLISGHEGGVVAIWNLKKAVIELVCEAPSTVLHANQCSSLSSNPRAPLFSGGCMTSNNCTSVTVCGVAFHSNTRNMSLEESRNPHKHAFTVAYSTLLDIPSSKPFTPIVACWDVDKIRATSSSDSTVPITQSRAKSAGKKGKGKGKTKGNGKGGKKGKKRKMNN